MDFGSPLACSVVYVCREAGPFANNAHPHVLARINRQVCRLDVGLDGRFGKLN
jgi:hypothetical protein